ncbi:MAG: hypothetical protein IKO61_03510 [Lachnospiraceae bacterium]|nr:hypothetical protein [Lachnospiraceae bacterium]
MLFLVEEDKIKLLLEKRRDFISGCKAGGAAALGGSLVFSGLTSDFPDIPDSFDPILRIVIMMVGALFVCFGLLVSLRNKKLSYNHKKLHKEIMELDMTSHRFSVVIIKDTFNEYANRYLLRYVRDWDCRLFFSFRTQENDNEGHLVSELSNALHIPTSDIEISFCNSDYVTKYSESDKVTKTYDHRYYVATIKNFSDTVKKEHFVIDDIDYYWMTYESMNSDERIREVNKDVIDYVRDNVA